MTNKGVAFEGYFQKYYSTRESGFYNFLLHEIIKFSKPGPILDVGSGGGLFLELCKDWGLSATGIEGSAELVKVIESRNIGLKVHNQLLSEPFSFPDNAFQTVVFNEVIEHLENNVQQHCLLEIRRVLKPGGTLIVHSPSKYNKIQREEDPTHINLLSPSDLQRLLLEAGFKNIVPIDNPLYIFGTSRVAKRLIDLIFRITKNDRLSATANCIAYK